MKMTVLMTAGTGGRDSTGSILKAKGRIMKNLRHILAISVKSFLIAALLGTALFLAWGDATGNEDALRESGDPSPTPPNPGEGGAVVELLYPTRGRLSRTLRFPGFLEPDTTVTVRPQTSGILEELGVEMGDKLAKGDIIGRIDPSSLDLNLKIAEAGFSLAESSLSKLERIYRSNGLSLQEYEEALSQFEISRTRRDLARLQLGFSEITAPFSGTVLKIHSPRGTLTSPEVPVITLGDLSRLKVKVAVPEEYYEKFHGKAWTWRIRIIREGEEITVTEAELFRLSPVIDPESRSFEAVCRLENPEERLKPGMVVKAEFIVEEEEGAYLPITALKGGSRLYYLEGDGSGVKSLPLSSPVYDAERVKVPAALADRPFVLLGPENLKEGDPVTPLGENPFHL